MHPQRRILYWSQMKVFISAGEDSGDQYGAALVSVLQRRWESSVFFGCAGPRLRAAGVHPVVSAERLAVVGLVEVAGHLPRIYRDFRRLYRAARQERPDLAILVDSPDFHLRLAAKLARLQIPVVYLIAPQAWAWRQWRVRQMRRVITRLLCIFPFEEEFFNKRGVPAVYIGHPLAEAARPSLSRHDFFRKHRLASERPLIAVLPGSRQGEAARHLPLLLDAIRQLNTWRAMTFVVAASRSTGKKFYARYAAGSGVLVTEGDTHNLLAHCDLALVASGTATVEAALLGAPMVTFYRVHPATWILGKWLVDAPFLSMVNLLAGRKIVPELIQSEFTSARLAEEARALLDGPEHAGQMRRALAELAGRLDTGSGVMERAADVCEEVLTAARRVPPQVRATAQNEVRSW
jgi:lipid-A-disaccharide synthase